MRNLLVALAVIATAQGCALTSRAQPIRWQYFTPERVALKVSAADPPPGPVEVCVGRVNAGTGLGKRIAYGDGGYQVWYYEDRRWTEEPERYVRRNLERTLFQQHGFRCDPDASGPTLDIEVLKFEELRSPDRHGARVVLRAVLATDHVLFDETSQAVVAVAGSSFDDVIAAVGRALDNASGDIARRTGVALAKGATSPTARRARGGVAAPAKEEVPPP